MATTNVLDMLKCKTCGSPLNEQAAQSANGVVKCPFCGNVWTIAKKETDPRALEFLRIGEHELDVGHFQEAFEAYDKSAECDGEEPEAYFGMALSEFGVRYIKDEVNNRLQPICYRPTDKKFSLNKNYRMAVGFATDEQQSEYKRRADEIDYINQKFYELQQAGVDYDCFLCVKVTGEDGDKTEDSKDADYIWQMLTDKGYKPFYSERNIRGQTGADYEAVILHALFTSETMIVVCRDEAYLQTPWVKNEYTRFLQMMRREDKETDAITVAYGGRVIETLPGKRGKIQGIDLDRRDMNDLITKFVEEHTPEHKKKKEAERAAKEAEEQRRLQEQEALKRQLEDVRQQMTEMAAANNRPRAAAPAVAVGGNVATKTLLKRAHLFLEDGDFGSADQYAEKVLDQDPENAEAYIVKLMAERHVKTPEQLKKSETPLTDSPYYKRALQFASPEYAVELKGYNDEILAQLEQKRKQREEQARKEREAEQKARKEREAEQKAREEREAEQKARKQREQAFLSVCEISPKGVLIKYNGEGGDVVIPGSVTSIGEDAFQNCTGLTSVTIGDGVTSIGDWAFDNCTNLTSVTIGDGVTSIGIYAFYKCTSLTSVTIGAGVTSIGEDAFSGCTGLTNVTIPDSVTSIGGSAFYSCTGLTSVTIGDGVTSIGNSAFYNCTGLTSVTIGDGVTSIGEYAFSCCYKLIEVYNRSALNISKNSTDNGRVGYYAQQICSEPADSKLSTDGNGYIIYTDGEDRILVAYTGDETALTLPDSVTAIYQYAFCDCTNLTSVTIPDSVESIGEYAFAGCKGLTNVTIPNSVTNIDYRAFSGCTGLTSVTIPDSVTSIGEDAFRNCTGLTNVTIGAGVTSIDGSAFSGCANLASITVNGGNTVYHSAGNCLIETESETLILGCKNSVIPTDGSVTSIDLNAFYNCTGLTSVTIPDSVTSIGWYAFEGCTALTSITIGDSVTSIGEGAFSGCSSLVSITIPFVGDTAGKTASSTCQYPFGYIFGTSSYTGGTATEQYYYGSSTSSMTSTTYSIPTTLRSVTVTGGNILYGAFYNCTGLTSVTIGDGVTSIGSAFEGCTGLTSITIGDGVTSIGEGAFSGCTGLTSVTIPGSVTHIGGSAFKGCKGLTDINYRGKKKQWKNVQRSGWKEGTGRFCVHCTNGDIGKLFA